MTTQYLILVLALGGAGLAVWAFAWAVRSGQLDDLDTPPARALLDDERRARDITRDDSPADRARAAPYNSVNAAVSGLDTAERASH